MGCALSPNGADGRKKGIEEYDLALGVAPVKACCFDACIVAFVGLAPKVYGSELGEISYDLDLDLGFG